MRRQCHKNMRHLLITPREKQRGGPPKVLLVLTLHFMRREEINSIYLFLLNQRERKKREAEGGEVWQGQVGSVWRKRLVNHSSRASPQGKIVMKEISCERHNNSFNDIEMEIGRNSAVTTWIIHLRQLQVCVCVTKRKTEREWDRGRGRERGQQGRFAFAWHLKQVHGKCLQSWR